MNKKVCLVILDGWGHGRKDPSNALFVAATPFTDSLYEEYPNAELRTDGENVGLPEGQMGNSEVGHTNIGAGRVVYQDLVLINKMIREGTLKDNEILKNAIKHAKSNNVTLHLMGLVSDGGVHSHISHLEALCDIANAAQVKVCIHAFTDGRDTDPKSGRQYIARLEKHIVGKTARIATICGRYYAMDRDKRWERVKRAYDLLVNGEGKKFRSADEVFQHNYDQNITDEFIEPAVVSGNDSRIKNGDVVICFNFRTDRCREITQVLTQTDMKEFGMNTLPLHYVTMTNYDDTFRNVQVMFDKDNLVNTLGEVIESNALTQLRIAETEKYPHVTFFFSGGREASFKGEKRIMIPSPKVATYDLMPEMSAQQVADATCHEMRTTQPDFICLNFANPDMVGHTGVFHAIVKAAETTDRCLKEVVECGKENNYSFIIIADHGNADLAVNEDGSPNTAHTTNPVPVWILDKDVKTVKNGILADVAPSILKMFGKKQPPEMTGKPLF